MAKRNLQLQITLILLAQKTPEDKKKEERRKKKEERRRWTTRDLVVNYLRAVRVKVMKTMVTGLTATFQTCRKPLATMIGQLSYGPQSFFPTCIILSLVIGSRQVVGNSSYRHQPLGCPVSTCYSGTGRHQKVIHN
jgi:hypothetical protein